MTPVERGSATVVSLGAMAMLVLVLWGALTVVSTVRDVHRARAAADLAALAGAAPLLTGAPPDCAAAASVAAGNGARLTRCAGLPDATLEVSTAVPLGWRVRWAGLPGAATARARAGVVPEGSR